MQMSRRAAAAAIAAAAIAAAAALVAAAHSRRARVGTSSDRRPAADAPRPRPRLLARAPPPASRTPGGVAGRRGGNECLCQSAPWGDGFWAGCVAGT